MAVLLNYFVSVLVVSSVYGFTLPFEGLYRLDIIHYNDFHARFEETSVESSTCRTNNTACLGGFPRLYHEIQVLRKEKPDSILINAGDSFQGTYWYTSLKWNITQQFMNLLPHDAHALGNHEFDDGPAGLAPYLSALKAPVVAANMDTSKEPILDGLYTPHIIVERKGRKIGIIGLITPETKILTDAGAVEFTDPGEATLREAQALTEKGVDIIVLLSHCGFSTDQELARDYGKYIDVIVGGHTHSLLWNGPSPSNETVHGTYPVFVQTAADNNHKVLIVQASAFTKYMGNLSVYFDFRGDYVKWDGGPIFLNRSIEEDEEIKAKLAPYAEKVHLAEREVVGESATTLEYWPCTFGECALGNLMVDSFNELGKSVSNSSLDHISFVQRGNIKSSIPQGPIITGVIFELIPYNDFIYTFELQGKYILEALERGVSEPWETEPQFKGPWLLQVSGIRVVYNVSLPEGERVTSVLVGDKMATKPFDQNQYYQVTIPSYLANGGDGYKMINDHKTNVKVVSRDQKVLTSYITEHSPLNVVTEGRLVLNT